MRISVNGENRELPADTTLAELLNQLGLESRHVAVEVNLELVPRANTLNIGLPRATGWKW